jgi:hypothetical protein
VVNEKGCLETNGGEKLAIYRRLFGNLSAIVWQFIGDYLAIYRRLFGNLSAIVWQFIGGCLAIYPRLFDYSN